MNTATTYTPDELEAEIAATGLAIEREYANGHKAQARALLEDMRRLVTLRTPETILRMEIRKGLI